MSITVDGVTFNGGDAWDHVTFRGVTVNKRTAAFILDVEEDLGHRLTIIQGSYNPGVSQSGGTHDKGGVFDCWDVFGPEPLQVQRKLRAHGGFGWYRPTIPGLWNHHLHCGVLGETDMSAQLAAQVPDYRNYLDGLDSHNPDNTWHPFAKGDTPVPTFDYPKWLKEHFVPFPFTDEVPATDNKTLGDAYREALRGDEHAAEIKAQVEAVNAELDNRFAAANANINGFQVQMNTKLDALAAAVATLTP